MEFNYDLRDVENILRERDCKVVSKPTMIDRIHKLRLVEKGLACKTQNGYITDSGQTGSKWLLNIKGVNELIDELDDTEIQESIEFDIEDTKERLRVKNNGNYDIEVDGELVRQFQEKGIKWKEDLCNLVNKLLSKQLQKFIELDNKRKEIIELRKRQEELEEEVKDLNEMIIRG